MAGAVLKTDGARDGMGINTSALRQHGRLTGQAHRHRLEAAGTFTGVRFEFAVFRPQSMIPKSGIRFSEKIMRNQKATA